MQLVEELLPDVQDAPILGGHNRQPKAASAAPIPAPTPSAAQPHLGVTHLPELALLHVASSGSKALHDAGAFRTEPAPVSFPVLLLC